MFLQLIILYLPAIACSCLAAVCLSWRGIHIVAQRKSLQVFCMAQGAITGSLAALIFNHDSESGLLFTTTGFLSAFAGGLISGYIAYRFSQSKPTEKPNRLLSFFIFLMGLNSLLSATFPQVEHHMSQAFFGDLATITDQTASIGIGVYLLLAVYLFSNRYFDTNFSFSSKVLGVGSRSAWQKWIFDCILVAISVQVLGFLFTLAAIMVPTTISRIKYAPGLNKHYFRAALTGCLGTGIGFVVSIASGSLPTVPTIIIMTFIIGSLITLLI